MDFYGVMEIIVSVNKIIFGVLGTVKGGLVSLGSDVAATVGSLGTLYFTVKNYKENKRKLARLAGRLIS